MELELSHQLAAAKQRPAHRAKRVSTGMCIVVALHLLFVWLLCRVTLTRQMQAVLFDIAPSDPSTFVQVIAVLLATALLASWLPARRALGIDSVTALRYE